MATATRRNVNPLKLIRLKIRRKVIPAIKKLQKDVATSITNWWSPLPPPYEDCEEDDDSLEPKKAKEPFFDSLCQKVGLMSPTRFNTYRLLTDACGCDKAEYMKNRALVKRLIPSCNVYRDIEKYVNNSGDGKLSVQKIYIVWRHAEERKLLTEKNRMMLWVKAESSLIPKIIGRGMKAAMVTRDITVGRNIQYLAPAVYLTDRIQAIQEDTKPGDDGTQLFILAEVAQGKIYEDQDFLLHKYNMQQPDGCDCTSWNGTHVPDRTKDELYHYTVIIPSGPTVIEQPLPHLRDKKRNKFTEFALYDPARAQVRFIVECQTVQ